MTQFNHSAPEQQPPKQNLRRIATIALAGCLLLAVGWGLAQLVTGNSSTSSASNSKGAAKPAVTSAQVAPPAAANSSAPAVSVPGDCASEIAKGEAVAAAAVPIGAHWALHTSAQTDFDEGRISAAEAEGIWKSTKAHGQHDLDTYSAADKAFEQVKGSCAKADTSALGASACQDRATALDRVVAMSAPVEADWAAHVAAMKAKTHSNPVDYDANWRVLVDRAPGRIAEYNAAVATLAAAPKCQLGVS